MTQPSSIFSTVLTLQTPQTLRVVDYDNPGGHNVVVPAGSYALIASSGSGDGTKTNPWQWAAKLEELLGAAHWNVGIDTNGKLTIQNWSVAMAHISASAILRVLGTTGSIDLSPATSTTLPEYAWGVFAIRSKSPDTGTTIGKIDFSFSDTNDGAVIGWNNINNRITRKFSAHMIPRDMANYVDPSVSQSVCFPADNQLKTQLIDPATYTPPNTFLHFRKQAMGNPINVIWDWPYAVSSGDMSYHTVYITAESLNNISIKPTVEYWKRWVDVENIETVLYGTGSY